MRILIIIILAFFALNLSAQEEIEPKQFDLKFNLEHIDLGEVNKGDEKSDRFSFINSGLDDIKIELVSSCECTTLDWSRGIIAPEEEGFIEFTFNSKEKEENETIDIEIFFTNTDDEGNQIIKYVTYTYKLVH